MIALGLSFSLSASPVDEFKRLDGGKVCKLLSIEYTSRVIMSGTARGPETGLTHANIHPSHHTDRH